LRWDARLDQRLSVTFPVISCYFQAICPFHVDFLLDFGFTPPPITGIYKGRLVFWGYYRRTVVPAACRFAAGRHQFGARTDPEAIYIT
jgi:hypothetical protein